MHLPALLLVSALSMTGVTPQETEWPFGGSTATSRRDLYNLGALGIKASDAINGEPERQGTGRRQVSLDPVDTAADVGPEKLRIEILMPGGPAEKAGLQIGDLLLGAGSKKFDKGSFEPLAAALQKALSKDGEVPIELRVERGADGKKEKVEVLLAGHGKPFAKLDKAPARALLARPALEWLKEKQLDSGGYAQTLSGVNGAVVQACMAGLAWIGSGSNLETGDYRDEIAKAHKFVMDNLDSMESSMGSSDSNWNQENWGWVHAGIFLGELHVHSPSEDLAKDLQTIVAGILEGVEESGGFAHGPGGPNALGYVELNIVTGLALCGLGLAERAGCEIDREAIEKMQEYIEASSGGGGVGYSTKDGQVGQGNIGRTAVSWLGYRLLGDGKSKASKAMGNYIKRNAGEVLGGHASLMQHVLWSGLAAQAQGGGAAKNFWSTLDRDLVLAHAPDGSFQPRPWHESLSMASNSDVTFGDVWTTAAWCCVLVAKPIDESAPGLKALLGN